jgi:hypothetical protein
MGLFCGTWGGETIKWYPVATCWKPLQERETLSNNETNQYDMEHFPSKHGLWYSIHFFPKLFGMLVPNDNFSWNESTTNFFWGGVGGRYPFPTFDLEEARLPDDFGLFWKTRLKGMRSFLSHIYEGMGQNIIYYHIWGIDIH